jgi:GT2 family glycosyltransferase
MDISVIIPTYNRLKQLKRVLGGFGNQTYPRDKFEVLVVSDGSNDGTDAYLRVADFPFHLRAFFQPNQGAAAARNLGVSNAAGEIVLFIDDDVFPLPELIEEHLHYHTRYGECAVVIGPMLAPPGNNLSPWVRWEADQLAEQYRDMAKGRWAPTARQFYTGNSSIARYHLLQSGGFDPSFKRAEDVELAYRLAAKGLKFFFNPRAAGHHYAERSLTSWLSIPYAYGRNDVIFSGPGKQAWLIPTIVKEFGLRHPLIRILVRNCLPRPVLSKGAHDLLRQIILLSDRLHMNSISSIACSGMFNLRYYEGVADHVDDRQAFLKKLRIQG